MNTRPYEAGDENAIAALLTAAEGAFGIEPFFTATDIRDDMGSWIKNPDRDTRLCLDTDGTLMAYAAVVAPSPGGTHGFALGVVHPERQGRGLGRELIAWQFERFREMHAEQAPGREWDVDGSSSEKDTASARLFARFGMRPVRYFFEMRGALPASGESAPTPEGLRLVPFTEDLAEQVYEAHVETFADHWSFEKDPYEDFAKRNYGSEMFRPDLSRIALDGDEVAGYVLSFDNVPGQLLVGLVGTRRAWRKRGLASAMLTSVLEAGTADGKTHATLGVDADSPTGAVGVYERAGLAHAHTFVTYRGSLH